MLKVIGAVLIPVLVLVINQPVCADNNAGYAQSTGPATIEPNPLLYNKLQKNTPSIPVEKEEICLTFEDWINKQPYHLDVDKDNECQKVRDDWERALGRDFFSPYFKAEKIKEKVEEKSIISVKKIKGRAKITEEEAKYIFTIKF